MKLVATVYTFYDFIYSHIVMWACGNACFDHTNKGLWLNPMKRLLILSGIMILITAEARNYMLPMTIKN